MVRVELLAIERDLFKFIFRGYCEESCPVDSIVERNSLDSNSALHTSAKALAVCKESQVPQPTRCYL